MKQRNSKLKGKLLKPLIIFLVGIGLVYGGGIMLKDPVPVLSYHYQPTIGVGALPLILGVAFIIGAFLQLRTLGKDDNITQSKNKKRKNKKL